MVPTDVPFFSGWVGHDLWALHGCCDRFRATWQKGSRAFSVSRKLLVDFNIGEFILICFNIGEFYINQLYIICWIFLVADGTILP